MPQSSFKKN